MKRAVSIGLTILLIVFFIVAFTDADASQCQWSFNRVGEASKLGALPAGDLAFQLNGGDNEFAATLRTTFRDELATKVPSLHSIIDGPPPRGAHLLRYSLSKASITWTPVWATSSLGGHVIVQSARHEQDAFELELTGTCKGLVSRSVFKNQIAVELARRLVYELDRSAK